MKIEFNDWENETGVKNDISELNGEIISTISGVEKYSEEVIITTATGKAIKLYHEQDCCESVSLVDFDGEPASLIGALVNCAEEVSGEQSDLESGNSQTWTFYKIETSKGGLWLRWLGESNGYYSESVDVVGGRVVTEASQMMVPELADMSSVVNAQYWLLQQCQDILKEHKHDYVELNCYLNGSMPVEDLIELSQKDM